MASRGTAEFVRYCCLSYSIANEIYLALDETAHFSLLRVVFIYFYFRGTIQLFREHRSRAVPQPVNT
jgi:hypothetical protein